MSLPDPELQLCSAYSYSAKGGPLPGTLAACRRGSPIRPYSPSEASIYNMYQGLLLVEPCAGLCHGVGRSSNCPDLPTTLQVQGSMVIGSDLIFARKKTPVTLLLAEVVPMEAQLEHNVTLKGRTVVLVSSHATSSSDHTA